MFGGHERQVNPGKARHLATPEASGIDDPAGPDVALWCFHDPGTVSLRQGRGHRGKAVNLCPLLARADRIGVCHARWVHIAAVGFIHDAADAVIIDQRVQPFGLGAVDLVKIHAVEFGLCGLQLQLMFTFFGLRKIERSGLEHATGLSRLFFQRVIEVHGIVLDAADIGAVVQPVNIGRGVPGRARRQLIAFQQHHI